MYLDYWQFKEKPFSSTPDQHFLYYSAVHEEALIRLLYLATERTGALLLTGDVGCGKTLISRVFIHELHPNRYDVALINNPNLNATDFIREILYQLGFNTPANSNKADLIHQLNDLVWANARKNKHTIIIIDEAQTIKDETTLEEIRLLLNFQQNDQVYISLILMGQPELRARIELLPQLKQRLNIRYHLPPLNAEETQKYILHRLNVAGLRREIFNPEAFPLIYRASQGIPRQINNICDIVLLLGFGQKVTAISADMVKQVVQDLEQS